MSEPIEAQPVLDDMTPLMPPWRNDPWGRPRPLFSAEALRMSAELAKTTYDMAVEPWVRAGWRDVTIQMDNSLAGGVAGVERSPLEALAAGVRLRRLKAQLQPKKALGQLTGAFRQRDTSQTCKAVVMAHPAADGRFVIAIGFMGTGAQLYDWVSNFRLGTEEGYHQGFLQLVRQFESNAGAIAFPETAKALGREKLTLQDALNAAHDADSPFRFWLAGHSQGAALMQIWCDRRVKEGVRPETMLGYGFASPSVSAVPSAARPDALPLYHVMNTDDLVPRMGSRLHLGELLLYPADNTMRASCYALPTDAAGQRAWRAVAALWGYGIDTPTCLALGLALLDACIDLSPEELAELIGRSELMEHAPLRRLMQAADQQADRFARYLRRRFAASYAAAAGHPPCEAELTGLKDTIRAAMDACGNRELLQAFKDYGMSAHSCNAYHGCAEGTYMWIAAHGAERLVPAHWECEKRPRLIAASRPLLAMQAAAPVRHVIQRPRRIPTGRPAGRRSR